MSNINTFLTFYLLTILLLQEYGVHMPVSTATMDRTLGQPSPQTATLLLYTRIGLSGVRCTAAPATPSRGRFTGAAQVGQRARPNAILEMRQE
ncbi:hypothetical protein XENOCAPTIV_021875 [Xenoophorus captivus]|uniref:Secreted protein n=1 Tax=Xenoophorus captivus TaxID=1517983 RepID=A0ABV0SJR6_9TELE